MFRVLHLKTHAAGSQALCISANSKFSGEDSSSTSASRTWVLGLWMRKVKASSHTGSLVLYLIWRGSKNRRQDVGSVPSGDRGLLLSHLAVKGLWVHSELDKRTGIAGHLLARLREKKRFTVLANEGRWERHAFYKVC